MQSPKLFGGALTQCIDQLIRTLYSRVSSSKMNCPSMPSTSAKLQSMMHGGLDFANTSTQAIPDFVLTMAHANKFVNQGICLTKVPSPLSYLPQSLTYRPLPPDQQPHVNNSQTILHQKQLYTYCEVISSGYAYVFYTDQKLHR